MKIAFSSGLGAVIGAILAFIMFPGLSWLAACIGMVVGGLVGFIYVDLAGFRKGAASAWREVSRKRDIRWFSRAQWARLGWGLLATLSLGSTMGALISTTFIGIEVTTEASIVRFGAYYTLGVTLLVFLPMCMLVAWKTASMYETNREGSDIVRGILVFIAAWVNPIGIVVATARGVAWCFVRIPKAFAFASNVVSTTYIKVVSDARLCALLGGATGTLAGFLTFQQTSQVVIGTLIALLIGSGTGYLLSKLGARAVTAKIRPK